ncbi:unnamed protein product [Fraxinus pennsylvanica]|uniref:Uncharacterized protein n=1 Tax=Fraxinus pennsylvanica TaxID=56036 RepID=A0AAD1ZM69_9LAMI|nr:unnamed protein product [Fraxinus pennsylvanica]
MFDEESDTLKKTLLEYLGLVILDEGHTSRTTEAPFFSRVFLVWEIVVILLRPPTLQKILIDRIEGSLSTSEFEHKVVLTSVYPYLFIRSHSTKTEQFEIDQDALEASGLHPNKGVKTRFVMELVRLGTAKNEN